MGDRGQKGGGWAVLGLIATGLLITPVVLIGIALVGYRAHHVVPVEPAQEFRPDGPHAPRLAVRVDEQHAKTVRLENDVHPQPVVTPTTAQRADALNVSDRDAAMVVRLALDPSAIDELHVSASQLADAVATFAELVALADPEHPVDLGQLRRIRLQGDDNNAIPLAAVTRDLSRSTKLKDDTQGPRVIRVIGVPHGATGAADVDELAAELIWLDERVEATIQGTFTQEVDDDSVRLQVYQRQPLTDVEQQLVDASREQIVAALLPVDDSDAGKQLAQLDDDVEQQEAAQSPEDALRGGDVAAADPDTADDLSAAEPPESPEPVDSETDSHDAEQETSQADNPVEETGENTSESAEAADQAATSDGDVDTTNVDTSNVESAAAQASAATAANATAADASADAADVADSTTSDASTADTSAADASAGSSTAEQPADDDSANEPKTAAEADADTAAEPQAATAPSAATLDRDPELLIGAEGTEAPPSPISPATPAAAPVPPVVASIPRRESEAIEIDSPIEIDTSPERPDWVDDEDQLKNDGVYRVTVSAGPYETRVECDRALDEAIHRATSDYLTHLQPGVGNFDVLDRGYLRSRLVTNVWEERRETSVGPMRTMYARLEYSPDVRRHLEVVTRQRMVNERLAMTGVLSGALLAVLGTLFGYFKLDTMTRGYYSTRLKLLSGVVILGILAGIVSLVS
ncbi:MAG: hypothetical protein R3C10_07715 [Pirellulales bacterium]